MQNHPNQEIIKEFNLKGDPKLLSGGQGTTYRVGEGVIKPIEEYNEALFVADCMNEIVETDFRVARPIKAKTNSWVYNGWVAYQYVEGDHKKGRLAEKIVACKAFHEALRNFSKPDFLDKRTHIYARADKMAWQEQELTASTQVKPLLELLQNQLKPVHLKNQLIHGDFAGNVLFSDELKPAIIDFSPYWRPAEYALAILLVDAIAWENAEFSEMKALASTNPTIYQLMTRALIGRVMQLDLLMQEGYEDRTMEIEAFRPLAEKLTEV